MLVKKAPFRTVFVGLFIFGAIVTAFPVQAQSRTGERSTLTDLGETNPVYQLRQRLSSTNVPIPLEGALDPDTYIVGPGDLFNVSIGGPEPILLTYPVSADGYLSLTDVGSVLVAGKTLGDAKTQALSILRPNFENVHIDVSLAQPRQFYVHVSGAVPVPGRYLATPVARLAGILELAYADTTRAPVFNTKYRPSLRNVTLIRNNDTVLSVDLQRYFATGDTRHNPYLNDGDIISVPTFDPNYEAVFIDGAVAFPGIYDFRTGDTVSDLLALTTGEMTPATTRTIRLTHREDDGTSTTSLFMAPDSTMAADDARKISPLDHMYVLPEETIRGTASVEGWVLYPGTYPIIPNQSTLRGLLNLAGGLRPGALLRGAYLERNVLPDPTVHPDQSNRFETPATRPEFLRSDTTIILQNMRLAEFDFISRAYFAQEYRLQNRVSVDIETALDPDTSPVYLQDGDRLVVPHDEQTVYVFGQVTRPGYVSYQPGRMAQYYIDVVGGKGALAGDAFVVKAGTGQYLGADTAVVESGDLIFLDRRIDLAESADLQRLILEEERSRKDARIRSAQAIAQIVTTVALVVTTYLNIRK